MYRSGQREETKNKEQQRTGRIPKKSDVMNKFQRRAFSGAKFYPCFSLTCEMLPLFLSAI